MCFVHKHMQNADFGQILCRRASTKRHVTSRPMVRFSQTWYQKMRKTWKKKVMKRRVAICGGREAVADFVQGGGGQIDPPPPVKIGLIFNLKLTIARITLHYIDHSALTLNCMYEYSWVLGNNILVRESCSNSELL